MLDHEHRCLVFGIGELVGAIPLHHVSETMRCLPVEPLSGAPSFVRGVAIVRGIPTPILDGPALLLSPKEIVANRLVVLKIGDRLAGLAVESIVGIRPVAQQSQQALPPLLQNAEIVSTLGLLDTKLLMVLHAGRLVPDDVWNAVREREVAS